MSRRTLLVALTLLSGAQIATAEERLIEKDGVTYRETRRVVQRPVVETRYEQREQTVYRERYDAEIRETSQTYFTPVTEYRWVTVLKGRWNPFSQPYLAPEYKPVTTWQAREHIIRTPVARRELVPEKRIVQVPVTTQRMAEEEIISRVAVSPSSGTLGTRSTTSVGGVARLESDPPRQSTNWRAAGRY